MIGPRTLDGGYSPSQVMSSEAMLSAKEWEDGMEVVLVETAACGIGANAAETARIAERMKKVSLAIFYYSIVRKKKVSKMAVKKIKIDVWSQKFYEVEAIHSPVLAIYVSQNEMIPFHLNKESDPDTLT